MKRHQSILHAWEKIQYCWNFLFASIQPLDIACGYRHNWILSDQPTRSSNSIFDTNMDRLWIALLVVLTIALVRMCDCQKDSTGGRQEMWEQLRELARSQGHSAVGAKDAVPDIPSRESLLNFSHNVSHSGRRAPVSSSSQRDNRYATAIKPVPAPSTEASLRAYDATVPRDAARRAATQLGTHHSSQQRPRISSRQSNKPSSTHTRRLAG